MTPQFSIIIPVKPVGVGKSRLRATTAVTAPDELVTAIALDTITAALTVADVLVVTNDAGLTEVALALGATVVPDRPDAGLNAAIAHGDAVAGVGTSRAALTADLPALRPADLADALAAFGALSVVDPQAAVRRGYVADHTGTGTTMLLAPPGVPLDPRFGLDSAAAHSASGALALDGDWASLRLDVDTAADLAAARLLGLGKRTAAAL